MSLSRNARNTALLTALHLLVDGMCACSVLMLQPALEGVGVALLFVGYNVLAFMTQPFVGLWTDRRCPGPRCLWASVLLLFCGALLTLLHPLCSTAFVRLALLAAIALLLGMGNSIFHVWGGKSVTDSTANDSRHLGVFVSSGALGLALGGALHSVALMVALALAMLLIVTTLCRFADASTNAADASFNTADATSNTADTSPNIADVCTAVGTSDAIHRCDVAHRTDASKRAAPVLLLFMLLLVFGRSFVGNMKPASVQSIAHYAAIASVLAFVGKSSGGFVAQKFGAWTTLTLALMLSGACLLLSGMHWTFAVLMVLCINITMPLTLHLANRSMPQRAGFAFGALAFMLIPGHALALYFAGSTAAIHLLYTLVATIIIEALVLLALHERRWKVLAASVVMNVLTNLPLNFAVRFVPALHHPSFPLQIVLECVVVVVESLLFYAVTRRRRTAMLYALLCNATSYLCGLLFGVVYHLFL